MPVFGTIMDNVLSHLINMLIDKSSERGNVQSDALHRGASEYIELALALIPASINCFVSIEYST